MRALPILAAVLLAACGAAETPAPSTSGSGASEAPPSATASANATAGTVDDRTAGWTEDLRSLVTIRERIHPEPWHGIEREAYVAAVEDVVARVTDRSDDELMVDVVRLAAMPTWAGRDGHGGIYPWGEGTYPITMLPLRLYRFSDGWFVVGARAPYLDLIGERVTGIGGHEVESVLEAVEPLVPRDNEQQVLTHGARLMVAVEVLHGLGLVDDPGQPVAVTFADAGEVAIEAIPMPAYEAWAGGHHTHSPPARPGGPAWIRRATEDAWWEWQAETGTAYIQINVVAGRNGPILDALDERLAAGEVERIVLDLRHNPGGNNTLYAGLIQTLREAEASGVRLYVIMGRATFSAAGNLVTELEQTTDATLVGEASGTSPNQYGDSSASTLPHSGLVFRVAPYYVVSSHLDDLRTTIEPDLPAPLSSGDYFGDRDPAMEAILADS